VAPRLPIFIDGPLVLPLFKGRSDRGDGLEPIGGLLVFFILVGLVMHMIGGRERARLLTQFVISRSVVQSHPSAPFKIKGFVAKPSLYEFYNATFENVVADTDALRTESYRLRHQVYCFEIKTEKPNRAGLECDEYDGNATHFLLRYRPSNIFIGTTRAILPPPGPEAQPLPYMKLCKTAQISMPSGFPHERAPEVSRFALSKDFRRRALDTSYSIGSIQEDLKEDRARIMPCMAIGLIAMICQFSKKNGYDRCCAVMKPALLQLLSKLGIHFVPVGPLVEYHGSRQICYIIFDDLMASVMKKSPDIAEIITDGGRYL